MEPSLPKINPKDMLAWDRPLQQECWSSDKNLLPFICSGLVSKWSYELKELALCLPLPTPSSLVASRSKPHVGNWGSWGSSEIPNRSSLTLLPLLWNSLFSLSECTLSISHLVRIQTSISTVIEIWCYIVKWTNRLVFYLEAKLELREADFVLVLTLCKTNLIKLGWWRHLMWAMKDIPSSTFLLERIRMHPI